MDYGRLAGNRIEGLDKLAGIPCDMGWTGNGRDHPFLFARALAIETDPTAAADTGEPMCQGIPGLAVPVWKEARGECRVYRNQHNRHYVPHDTDGRTHEWYDRLKPPVPEEPEEGEPEPEPYEPPYGYPVGTEELEYREGGSRTIPIVNAAQAAQAALKKEWKQNHGQGKHPDWSCWVSKPNCQRLCYWMDVVVTDGNTDPHEDEAEALAGRRWGWFRPVRKPPAYTAFPKDTRLVGRPLVGGYNKTMILPPPEEGWSEEWEAEHPGGSSAYDVPWEGYWVKTVDEETGEERLDHYVPPDKKLRQDHEFGRSPVKQMAFGDVWEEFRIPDQIDWNPDKEGIQDAQGHDVEPYAGLKKGYIGKSTLPHPGFANPYREAERWALVPLRGCIGYGDIPESFEVEDYDQVVNLKKDDHPEEKIMGFRHVFDAGEYDWRFFCGMTERRDHTREKDEEGNQAVHVIEHRYHPLWWSIGDASDDPATPWDEPDLLAEIGRWANHVHGIPCGTRIDVMVVAYVYGMKIGKPVADRLRSWGWERVELNVGSPTKWGREWWHTHTDYEIRIRQHQPLC